MSADQPVTLTGSDERPVDIGRLIALLEEYLDNVGEVGIWGDYGPPAAPVGHLVRVIAENADAIENRTGEYDEEGRDA